MLILDNKYMHTTVSRGGLSFIVAFAVAFLYASSAYAQSTNLISNGSLETASGSAPQSWTSSYWGTPAPKFTYPATGNGNTKGASITLSANSSGDANWRPSSPTPVTAGAKYTYTTWYNSNVATEIDAEYTSSSGVTSYAWLADVPSSGGIWKQLALTFTVPASITKAIVYQLLDKKGTLTIDDVTLVSATGTNPPPTTPTVSISASPTSVVSGQASTLNWSASNATTCTASGAWSGSKATSGSQSVNPTVSSTYTITCTGSGASVSQSATISVSTNPPPTTPSLTFSASATSISKGQSTTLSWSTTNVTSCTASNGWTGAKATNGSLSVTPATNTTYALSCSGTGGSISKSVSIVVTTPPTPNAFSEGMVTFSFDDSWASQYANALPILQSAGIKGTFYLTTEPVLGGWSGYMTPTQIVDIGNKGHEIAGHTVTHPHLPALSSSQITSEIVNSKTYLQNLTGKSVTTFAYPYGEFNATAKSLVQTSGYTSARGVEEDALNTALSDKYNLKSSCIESGATFAQVKSQIDKAKAQKQWYILCFHEVKSSPGQYDTSIALFQQIVNYIKSSGIKTVTVTQGRALMAN